MENLGAHLQKLREEKGLDHQKVFEDLRLREDQLRLIEENRFFELGHFGFAKAMVYKYARYLEADMDEVMAEFNVMVPENTKKQVRREKAAKSGKIMLSPNLFWLLGIILFVAILGGILWYANNQGWLKTPDFLKPAPGDSTGILEPQKDPEEPSAKQEKTDPMREAQKKIVQTLATQPADQTAQTVTTEAALQDTTDHIGELMGASQVNVELD